MDHTHGDPNACFEFRWEDLKVTSAGTYPYGISVHCNRHFAYRTVPSFPSSSRDHEFASDMNKKEEMSSLYHHLNRQCVSCITWLVVTLLVVTLLILASCILVSHIWYECYQKQKPNQKTDRNSIRNKQTRLERTRLESHMKTASPTRTAKDRANTDVKGSLTESAVTSDNQQYTSRAAPANLSADSSSKVDHHVRHDKLSRVGRNRRASGNFRTKHANDRASSDFPGRDNARKTRMISRQGKSRDRQMQISSRHQVALGSVALGSRNSAVKTLFLGDQTRGFTPGQIENISKLIVPCSVIWRSNRGLLCLTLSYRPTAMELGITVRLTWRRHGMGKSLINVLRSCNCLRLYQLVSFSSCRILYDDWEFLKREVRYHYCMT